jgi:hypothetical protein
MKGASPLPAGPLPTGRQAVPTEGGAGRLEPQRCPPPTPSLERLCHNQTCEGGGNRVPKLWNAGLLGMGDRCWMKIECFHMVGAPECKRLKVAAPKLFRPTASPLFRKAVIFVLRHSLQGGRVSLPAGRQGKG